MRRSLLGLAAVLVLLCLIPSAASAKVKWLCAPGVKNNPCLPSFKTTVFTSWGGSSRVATAKAAKHPKVDCFYVYPTTSNQSANVATKALDPEIKDIALFQAARYSTACRMFAPVYRQITVQALTRQPPPTARERAIGDKDVLEAWKQYLAKYNKGRGFVLIGHSQGSFRLTTLIQRQIDKNPKVRRHLLSAILLGGNETVKTGSDRGGSFQNIPVCKSNTQLHCLIAFSSFNQTPPNPSLFGRAADPSLQVVCTNPASLGSNAPIDLDAIVPSKPFAPGTLISAGIQLLHLDYPKVSTPWLESTAAFSGQCADEDGASFLKITSNEGTPAPSPSPDATWGLHLLDANIALGDLVKLVKTETQAYLR
jgi:hypothetical protein